MRKTCHRQFIGDHALCYKDCHSSIIRRILLMLVRGIGIRDVSEIEGISIRKVLSVLIKSSYVLKPKHTHIMRPWKLMNFGLMCKRKVIKYGLFMPMIVPAEK